MGLDGVDGFFREPLAVKLVGSLTGIDIHPGDPLLALVSLLHRGVNHPAGGFHDIAADTITLDNGDDGVIRNLGVSVCLCKR